MLNLPQADDAAVAQMVAAQLEVMLPARSHLFTWDWDYAPGPADNAGRRVWLCAARKDAVEAAMRAAEGHTGRRPSRVVPASTALAAAVSALLADLPERVVVIDAAQRSATVLILHDGQLVDCAVLDPGPDQWSGQLREAYQSLVVDLPATQRPTGCVVLPRGAPTAGLEQTVAQALQLDVLPAATDLAPSDLAAAGAALTLVQPVQPSIVLIEVEAEAQAEAETGADVAPKRRGLRRVAVVVWLLLAALALYLADRHEATRLEAAVAEVEPAVAARGGFDRELALGRYLEKAGPAPLDVLAEVSELVSPKVIISKWSHAQASGVRLTGTAPNTEEFHKLLKALAGAKTLDKVEINSLKMEKDKPKFVIAALLSDTYVPSLKKKDEDKDKDKDKK